MEWQPIETYNALKKKPRYAIFRFAPTVHERRSDLGLPETFQFTRSYGHRVCTHWAAFEPPKGD